MSDLSISLPETIAAVDLGSNSFHMIVARPAPEEMIVEDRLREMIHFAAGLDKKGKLGSKAQERALNCLRRFGERVRHLPPSAVRAVGTNTLRSARNAGEFLEKAEQALGHTIETISGIEEARLIFVGVSHGIPGPDRRTLVLDIGGGSTELIVGERFQPLQMESLFLGCVTASRGYFPGGEVSLAAWKHAKVAARQEFEPVAQRFRELGWEQALGASGTVRAVDSVLREAGWSKGGITSKGLKRIRDALINVGHIDDLGLAGLNPRRRKVFPGGVAILQAAFESLGIEELRRSDGALREGLLYDLVGRMSAGDVRGRSVSALGDRYHVDWKHAARVECLALKFLAEVAPDWRLDSTDAQLLLRWAAQLHEIGLDIAHRHYHWHGSYIVAESDLFGFSREEQQQLAALVRCHRRKFPLDVLRAVPARKTRTIEKLAVLLRLAVLLHRSRNPDPLPEIGIEVGRKSVRLHFPEDWLDDHPLTRADLRLERAYLNAAGYKLESS